MYVIALLKNSEGDCYVHYDNQKDTKLSKVSLKELERIEALGYKFESCMITSNKVVSLKTRLNYKIQEFRALKPDVDYLGYDESLASSIGLITSRLIRLGVEVTDEVALQCYDIREQQKLKRDGII